MLEDALKVHEESANIYQQSTHFFDIHGSVHRKCIFKYNEQDATLHNVFIVVKCSTCFRRVFRPSSGAQNSIHSIGYLSGLTATCRCHGRAGNGLQKSPKSSTTATGSSKAWQVPDAVYTVLSS
jgi:hypothetical protein